MFEDSYLNDFEDGELFSMIEDYSTDLQYRSIDVARPANLVQHTGIASKGIEGPIARFNEQAKPVFPAPSSSCPATPRCLPVSKFTVSSDSASSVIQSVSEHLQAQEDFDCCFISNECMWRGKYLSGCSCFEVAINLYYDAPSNKYTIAVRKMKNDCAPNGNFTVFYTSLKNAVNGSSPAVSPNRSMSTLSRSPSTVALSSEDFLEGIRPIFTMACSMCQESRIQSAKMICDISSKDTHYLELPAFKTECVKTLATLVCDECDDVRQYAVVAIAALSELTCYQESFIASNILPILFTLVDNCVDPLCSYETAQVRRTAASVLATLSKSHPYTVRASLQSQRCDVGAWMQRVPLLLDTRTRESAQVVKSFLEDVSVENRLIDGVSFSDEFSGMECVFVNI